MSKLSDITNAAILALLGDKSLVKPVLAINLGGAATVKTTNALSYTVNGIQYAKAALAAQSVAVTHTGNGAIVGGGYIQPISTTVFYTLSVNAAGAVAVTQGSFLGQRIELGQSGTSSVGDGFIPEAPSAYTPFGVIKVVTNGAATFNPGTTALDAAGVSASYFDVAVLPAGTL